MPMPTFPPWGVRMVHCDRKTKIHGLPFKVGPDRCDDNANENSRVRMGGEETYNLYATWSVKSAILGPTPGSEHSSSTVLRTSASKASCNRRAVCLMCLVPKKKKHESGREPKRAFGPERQHLSPPKPHFSDGIQNDGVVCLQHGLDGK